MADILVVAPHPDDETLGCGGVLLKRAAAGDRLHWLIVTAVTARGGFPASLRRARAKTIKEVAALYGFASTSELGHPTTRLDETPLADLVGQISAVLKRVRPAEVYLPSRADAHSDHRVTFDAAASCLKWFRLPSVRSAYAYEALSETDQGLDRDARFKPDVFVPIERQLERKLDILGRYEGELGAFPFPRSAEAVRALAAVRGATAGVAAAEAFQLLRERR